MLRMLCGVARNLPEGARAEGELLLRALEPGERESRLRVVSLAGVLGWDRLAVLALALAGINPLSVGGEWDWLTGEIVLEGAPRLTVDLTAGHVRLRGHSINWLNRTPRVERRTQENYQELRAAAPDLWPGWTEALREETGLEDWQQLMFLVPGVAA